MELRRQFMQDVQSGATPITELCVAYGISRKTGYKWFTRRVSHNGGIRWRCTWVNVSQTLGGEDIGFVEIDDAEWDVYFGPLRLGRFHERTSQIEDVLGRHYRRHY
jgi:hypothetical protein